MGAFIWTAYMLVDYFMTKNCHESKNSFTKFLALSKQFLMKNKGYFNLAIFV